MSSLVFFLQQRVMKYDLICWIVLFFHTASMLRAFSFGHGWRPARLSTIRRNIHPMEIPCRNFAGYVDKSAPMLFYYNYGPNAPNRCDEIDIANTSLFDRYRKGSSKDSKEDVGKSSTEQQRPVRDAKVTTPDIV